MPWLRGGIVESFAQLVDRRIQSVVEIHDSVVAPEPLPHLLTGHHFCGVFQ
jgi:hypothetical protein